MFVNYAHRGASHYCPENTMLSFYTGVYMGANGIETDVRKTKDGVLVLYHDDTLKAKTGADGSVSDYTFEELKKLRVTRGDFSDSIVAFEDFLAHFCDFDLTFAIEIKEEHIEKEIAELIRRYGMEEKVVITSFEFSNLEKMHVVAPELRLGYLTSKTGDGLAEKMKANGIFEICPKSNLIDEAFVEKWHGDGFNVRAWGIKNLDDMKRVYDAGADGMTVNFPNKLKEYIDSKN